MAIFAYSTYLFLIARITKKLAFILAVGIAIIVYFISIIVLQIFSKEEIYMIPYGKKVYQGISFRKKI